MLAVCLEMAGSARVADPTVIPDNLMGSVHRCCRTFAIALSLCSKMQPLQTDPVQCELMLHVVQAAAAPQRGSLASRQASWHGPESGWSQWNTQSRALISRAASRRRQQSCGLLLPPLRHAAVTLCEAHCTALEHVISADAHSMCSRAQSYLISCLLCGCNRLPPCSQEAWQDH